MYSGSNGLDQMSNVQRIIKTQSYGLFGDLLLYLPT